MKPLPPSFFNLFDYSDESDLNKEGFAEAVMDYTQHPYIIFGTFLRSVENFYIVCERYRNSYGDKFFLAGQKFFWLDKIFFTWTNFFFAGQLLNLIIFVVCPLDKNCPWTIVHCPLSA